MASPPVLAALLVGVAELSAWTWLERTPLGPAACTRWIHEASQYCTKRQRNAHRTEEREVLYPWHPWAGSIVQLDEVVEKSAGDCVRCRHDGDPSRRLELPLWMFDRAVCAPMRVELAPQVDIAAIQALMALLADVSKRAPSTSTTTTANWISHDGNRGEAHATPEQPSSCPSVQTRAVRPVCPAKRRPPAADARLANPACGDTAGADEPDGSPNPRTRPRQPSGTGRGARS